MDPVPDQVRDAIEARLTERGVFGAAIAAFDRERVVYAGGSGLADIERDEPVTPSTVFRVASISKLLTTSLVLRLVEQGGLDLDRAVNDDLPPDLRVTDRHGAPARSSLRTLLSHTSGLGYGVRGADVGNRLATRLANGGRVRHLADAIAGLRTIREPGERVVYSNPAFNVVGHLAAEALGTTFEAGAEGEVFGPLGMGASSFRPRDRGPGLATPYGTLAPPRVSDKPAHRMRLIATPMGGLSTTVLDLARFGRMVLGRGRLDGARILGAETLEQAVTIEARNHGDLEQGYGLGFKGRSWGGGRTVIGHDGNMPGVATQLLLSPDDGVGVVVLTNGFALGVPHEVAALALTELIGAGPLSPTSIVAHDRAAWIELGRRIEGRYRLRDAVPAGLLGWITDRAMKIEISADEEGTLRVEGHPAADGTLWLHPDGPLGRYRAASRVEDGTNAVVEERADGLHLWHGFTSHLVRR